MNKIKSIIALFAVAMVVSLSLVSCKDDDDRVLNDQLAGTSWKYNSTTADVVVTFNADKTGTVNGNFVWREPTEVEMPDGTVKKDTIDHAYTIDQRFKWVGYDGENDVNYCEIKTTTHDQILLGDGVYNYYFGNVSVTSNGVSTSVPGMSFGGNTYIKL